MGQQFVHHRVHPALRPFVAAATGYRYDGAPRGVHRGLPSPYLTLVVTVDTPLEMVAHPDPHQAPGRYETLVGGLHTRPALIGSSASQTGLQLSLTPLGARALLGVPAAALASVDCPLGDLLGGAAEELTDRARAACDWAGRFAAVESVLLQVARPDAGPAPEVAEAWRLTIGSGGRLRVADVAREVGWSQRHLGERFRAETGLGPKEAGRVARFHRARRMLATRVGRGGRPDLALLAADHGYADQAHLTREWRAFSGLAPTRWLAAELGFVQDGTTADRPSSAA